MTNTYKPTPEKVAEWIKDHQYTQLVKTDMVEMWRCKNPKTTAYAFDLVMSRFGIAMYGDTGPLVWGVGIGGYGLKFLAGDDDDYVFNKLEQASRQQDLDHDYLLSIVYNAIIELLSERDVVLPEWKPDTAPMAERVEELSEWLMGADCADGEYSALVVALSACQRLENDSISGAYEWLSDHQELLELSDDLDYSLGKPSNSVMHRIYLVRHAAQQILAAQETTAAEVVQVAAGGQPLVIRGTINFLEQPPEPEYAYSRLDSDEWTDDGIAAFVSDRELQPGAQIMRGHVCRSQASDFLPDANDVIEHMANRAADENSEFCDGFPDTTPEQEAELALLLEPLKVWADKHCSVRFYQVEKMEPYTVTAEDVAAGEAYRQTRDADMTAGTAALAEPPKGQWAIWVEGYQATGQSAKAQCLGTAEGATFNEAVEAYLLTLSDEARSHYRLGKDGVWRCWACRLTASEAEARSTFG